MVTEELTDPRKTHEIIMVNLDANLNLIMEDISSQEKEYLYSLSKIPQFSFQKSEKWIKNKDMAQWA